MATALTPEEQSVERLADLMMRIEADRAFKLNALAVTRLDGVCGRVIVKFPDGFRTDLTPDECALAAVMIRLAREYPDYEHVARRFDAATTCADLAVYHMAKTPRIDGVAFQGASA